MTFQCIDNVSQFQNYSKLVIHRIPHVVYFAQDWNLPGLNLATSYQATPNLLVPLPGNQITFNDFSVTFVLDEDLNNYMEICEWMVGLGHPESLNQYKTITERANAGIYSDISISIMTNKRNPNKRLTMKNAFPYTISDVLLDNTGSEGPMITAMATFKYTQWEMESVGK